MNIGSMTTTGEKINLGDQDAVSGRGTHGTDKIFATVPRRYLCEDINRLMRQLRVSSLWSWILTKFHRLKWYKCRHVILHLIGIEGCKVPSAPYLSGVEPGTPTTL